MSVVLFRRAALVSAASMFPVVLIQPAHAQTRDASPVDPADVQTVVITADPFSRTADQLLQPSEVLVDEELDRRRAATLGETLEHELGVSTTDFGRGAGRPVIRGQAGPRVLMLENGIAAMDASDVSSDHAVSIDPAHADQIEILKGPATLLYGSGASAGVVNVSDGRLPTRLDEGLRSSVRLGGVSNADERNAAARFSYGFSSGTQMSVDGAWLDADDYEAGGDRGRIDNSALEKKSGSVSLAQIGERGSVAATYSLFRTEYGLPIEETAFIDLKQDRFDIEARVKQPLQGFESLRVRYGQGDYQHTEFEAPGEPGTVFYNDQNEGRVELVHEPFAGLRGVIGVQRRDREFQAIGDEAFVPSTDTRSVGVFLLESAPTDFGSVEFGVRTDNERSRPQDGDLTERRFNPFSYSGGVRVDLGAHYHLKVYATRAQRAPVTEELYSFGPHLATGSFERGRDDFDLESAHNLEVSLDRHGEALSWRVNLYVQRISDYIFQREVDAGLNADGSGTAAADGIADRVDEEGNFDPEGELLLVDYAAANARFWGTEGEVAYAWNTGPTEWRARVFGDLARGELKGGADLPRMTPARLGGELHVHRGAWSASVDFTRVLRQDRIASLETETPGYSMLGADLDWTLPIPGGSSVLLFLRGRNLLDEDARRHTSFIKDQVPLPGASVMAGLEWRLD